MRIYTASCVLGWGIDQEKFCEARERDRLFSFWELTHNKSACQFEYHLGTRQDRKNDHLHSEFFLSAKI